MAVNRGMASAGPAALNAGPISVYKQSLLQSWTFQDMCRPWSHSCAKMHCLLMAAAQQVLPVLQERSLFPDMRERYF